MNYLLSMPEIPTPPPQDDSFAPAAAVSSAKHKKPYTISILWNIGRNKYHRLSNRSLLDWLIMAGMSLAAIAFFGPLLALLVMGILFLLGSVLGIFILFASIFLTFLVGRMLIKQVWAQ